MKCKVGCLVCLGLWTVVVMSSDVRSVEIDFDGSADLALFEPNTSFSSTPFPWSSSAGVGGSGALATTGAHESNYSQQGLSLNQFGSTIEVSALFHSKSFDPPPSNQSVTHAQVHLVRELDEFPGFDQGLEVSVTENDSGVRVSTIEWTGNGSGGGRSFSFPGGILQPDHWYEVVSKITNVGSYNVNWQIEINDYGTSGLEFVENVAAGSRREFVLPFFTDDETLYAGFGASQFATQAVDNFSVNSGLLQVPTSTIEILPTFDIEFKEDGVVTLIEGSNAIRLGNDFGAPNEPPSGAILEFPLDAVPEGAVVVGAELDLSENAALDTPQLHVRGYRGDGLASISDVTRFASTLNPAFDVDIFSGATIPLDAVSVDNTLSASHLGLRITNNLPDNYMFLNALEAQFFDDPKLILELFVPGDFDGDGVVGASDLSMWESAYGLEDGADADLDGDVDGQDFLAWQRQSAQFAAVVAPASVPEPTAIWLLLSGIAAASTRVCWP